jgi:hypothetical protein
LQPNFRAFFPRGNISPKNVVENGSFPRKNFAKIIFAWNFPRKNFGKIIFAWNFPRKNFGSCNLSHDSECRFSAFLLGKSLSAQFDEILPEKNSRKIYISQKGRVLGAAFCAPGLPKDVWVRKTRCRFPTTDLGTML